MSNVEKRDEEVEDIIGKLHAAVTATEPNQTEVCFYAGCSLGLLHKYKTRIGLLELGLEAAKREHKEGCTHECTCGAERHNKAIDEVINHE